MRFAYFIPALYALTATAAPLPEQSSAVTAQTSIPRIDTAAFTAILPTLRKFLSTHASIEADIAQHNPMFASAANPNLLDFDKVENGVNMLNTNQEPAPATDMAGAVISGALDLLSYLPGAIVSGVGGILSMEYSLISGIFSTLLSFVPGFGKTM
jgi:hypothetical protein